MASTVSVTSRALLLVENDVDEAYRFSRTVKASEVDCDFYAVAGLPAAKRYLLAAETDVDCLPAVVIVSMSAGLQDVTDLVEWIRSREVLRGCSLLVLGDGAPSCDATLQKTVTADQLRQALLHHLAPAALASA